MEYLNKRGKFFNKLFLKISDIKFNPYKLKYQFFNPVQTSDFFVWSSKFKKNFFIAENPNALINGIPEKVIHKFLFFSPEGNFLKEHLHETEKFFEKIELPRITEIYEYLSFVHFKTSKKTIKNLFKEKNTLQNLKIASQSRGYTLYLGDKSNVSAAVHGNFGGISLSGIRTAVQRKKFVYTSIYNFEPDYIYNLVFNNPTDNNLQIRVKFFDKRKDLELNLNSMGTQFIQFSNYSGGISFESKLPICRPLIFKNPPPESNNFDVFHG